jgi:hypothetical protein
MSNNENKPGASGSSLSTSLFRRQKSGITVQS